MEIDDDLDSGFTDEVVEVVAPEVAATEAVQYAQITSEELDSLRARLAQVDELKAAQEKQFGTAFGKMGMMEKTLKDMSEQAKMEPVGELDLASLKEEYPELAGLIAKDLSSVMRRGGTREFSQEQLDAMVNERLAPALTIAESRLEQKFERRALSMSAPDWESTVTSQAFKDWVAKQPVDKQAQINNSWDSTFVINTIGEFKQTLKKPVAQQTDARTARLEAAIQPRGTVSTGAKHEDDDFEQGFASG